MRHEVGRPQLPMEAAGRRGQLRGRDRGADHGRRAPHRQEDLAFQEALARRSQ